MNQEFWDARYRENTTGWDLGEVSPPLKNYINQLKNKDLRILIPGCGNTYEAEYLLQQGFTNITVIDISPTLVNKLKEKFAGNSNINIVLGDFFEHSGQYDLILEQTFFCALNPLLRRDYCNKMLELLAPHGKLAGVLFSSYFEKDGPPFGDNKAEYETIFGSNFNIKLLEPCHNSASPRAGNELFFIFEKAL